MVVSKLSSPIRVCSALILENGNFDGELKIVAQCPQKRVTVLVVMQKIRFCIKGYGASNLVIGNESHNDLDPVYQIFPAMPTIEVRPSS